jgi:hypothetical protein
MPLIHGGYLTVGPVNDQPAFQVEWTYEVVETKPVSPPVVTKELTVEEQAWKDVQEYYKGLGKSVPSKEAKWCLDAIRMEKQAKAQEADAEPYVAPDVMPARPEYGTKEFWIWCAKTKKQREAAKKAKEDEKEAKRKAKEDAVKAKALEKIAKQEAKLAAKATDKKK